MIDRKSNGQLQSFLLDDKPLVKNPPTSCELIYFLAFRQTTTTFFSTNFFSTNSIKASFFLFYHPGNR